MPPKSVLIIRLSAIGDVVHALPVLDTLRRALPDARIGWLVEELSAPLLQGHPQLDRLYVIPKKKWRGRWRQVFRSEVLPFFREIRGEGWDATLDLQGLAKSGLASIGAGGGQRIGFGGPNARELNWIFSNRRVRPNADEAHVVQQNLALLRGIGIEPNDYNATGVLGIRDEEKDALRAKLRDVGWVDGERLLAINPGAGWSSKRWAPAQYAELARTLAPALGLRPIVLWGPGEEAWRDEIAAGIGPNALVAPPTRIRELAVLISLCSLYVGADTGATHMTGPLGVPAVALFGASDGKRNAPWPAARRLVIQRSDLACCPCWKTVCPLTGAEELACLRGLSPDTVAKQVLPWATEQLR